jgi:hypothetical protein
MIEVELPDGSIAEFPNGTGKEAIQSALQKKFGAPKAGNPVPDEKSKRDDYYSKGIYAGAYNPLGPIAKTVDAFASGAQRAPLFGWDDEAQAAVATGGGLLGDYEKSRSGFDARKQAIREQNPVSSAVGELAGGLATGGKLAQAGVTMAGRSLPLVGRAGGAAIEGAGYGALVGAGEAKPGDRLSGAALGGTVGALTGAAASKAGDMLATRFAKSASQAAAPTTDDIAAASNALYRQADQAGITLKPQTTDRLVANMKIAAGNLNDNLRPRTAGVVQDLADLQNKPLTLQQFDELRQSIGLAMKNADAQDVRTLQRMKTIVDSFADNANASDVTGNVQGFDLIKQARDLWAKKSKTELVEEMFDLADVKSARYSQSGMTNAVRDKASQLYSRIVNGKVKGFTKEETALVRQLAKGEMTPKAVQWAAKFAPRGVISFGTGVGLGSALGGPVGALLPGMVGYGAANVADRAAIGGVQALRNAAATGNAPVLQAITNKTVPFIGGTASELSSQITRRR